MKENHSISSTRSSSAVPSDAPQISARSEEVPETVASTESDEESEDDEDEDEEYDGFKARVQPTRSVRATTRKELPYSPRKLRQVVVVDSDDSDDYDDGSESDARNLRRSTRTRKVTTIRVDSEDDDYIDEDEDVVYAKRNKGGKAVKKKAHRPKSARPMYGRFRDIATLAEDPFSDDDDNEVLRRHRSICEKCHLAPAHKLLAAFKRKKSKGKKRKRSNDDEDEESDEEEHLIGKGGWVQWYFFHNARIIPLSNNPWISVFDALSALIGDAWLSLNEMKY